MIRYSIIIVSLFVLLAACNTTRHTRSTGPSLYAALDKKPNGTRGTIKETGEKFKIISTHASSTRLCRVVTLESPDRFLTQSYCKSKGGEWR